MKTLNKLPLLVMAGLLILSFCQPVMAASEKININEATKDELVTMKHVGDKIADRIIEYREKQPFETPEEIMNVKGIGQKVFDANKDVIVVKNE